MTARGLARTIAAIALLASTRSEAQCTATTGFVDYRVHQHDTLIDIAQRYLNSAADWHLLQSINHVRATRRLVPGSTLRMPLDRVRRTAVSAVVSYALGETSLAGVGGGLDLPLLAGDRVVEGNVVKVGLKSYLTLQMPDKSLVHLDAGSTVKVAGLCQMLDGAVHMAFMRLSKGRVESTVSHQQPGSRFEVVTPLAVAGVRGTRFGVELISAEGASGADERTDVTNGVVQVDPVGARAGLTAAHGQGVRIASATGAAELSVLLDAPDLSSVPADQLSTVLNLPVIEAGKGTAYRFKIATDPDFNHVVVTSTEKQLPIRVAGLSSGTYFISVRAEDAFGMPGMEAVREVRLRTDPRPPILREPDAGALVMGPAIDFVCAEGTQTLGYRMEVSDDPAFASPRALASQDTCRFHADGLGPATYYWRGASVARNADGELEQGPWSTVRNFIVAPPLERPEPVVHPAEGDTVQIDLDGGAGNHFLLQLATDEQFHHMVRQSQEEKPEVMLQLKRGATYFLRVQLVNTYGWRSEFSSVQKIDMPLLWKTGSDAWLKDSLGNILPLGQ